MTPVQGSYFDSAYLTTKEESFSLHLKTRRVKFTPYLVAKLMTNILRVNLTPSFRVKIYLLQQ